MPTVDSELPTRAAAGQPAAHAKRSAARAGRPAATGNSPPTPTTSRRGFLKTSTALLAAPTIVPASALGREGQPPPSERVVVGSIGTGDLGRRHHLRILLDNPRVRVGAVCDVDRSHREEAARDVLERTGARVGVYRDFRDLCDQRDLDAVLIAVPDHWHALTATCAMESGKDVYLEKPLTLTIAEGQHLVRTARRYGTVIQTGSQQRSDGSGRFPLACELVRNGKIGRLEQVDTYIGGIDGGQWQTPTTPPPELDWNFWLGPAPWSEFTPNRCHYQFRWFSDYSGGKMTDWGAHHNDIAQWGIGADGSGPVSVEPLSVTWNADGPHDVPLEFDVLYRYANGVQLVCHSQGENGVKFTGTDGWIFVSRGSIAASDPELLKIEPTGDEIRLPRVRNHHNNWLDCIASRERPICDVEIGHRSVTVCHLGNIALRLGRPLNWDPEREEFVGDEQANLLCTKPMRSPWHL